MNRGFTFKRNGRLAIFLLSILIMLGVMSTPQTTTASYIVQGESLEAAVTAVSQVNGTITHELSVINAVGAQLTASQSNALDQTQGIRIYENTQLSRRWRYE